MLWLLLEKPGECEFVPGFRLRYNPVESIAVTLGPWQGQGQGSGHGRGMFLCFLPPQKQQGSPLLSAQGQCPSPLPCAPLRSCSSGVCPELKWLSLRRYNLFPHPDQSSDAKPSTGRAVGKLSPSSASLPWGTPFAEAAQAAAGWETANPTPFVLNTLFFPPYSTHYRVPTQACSIRALGTMLGGTSSLCCP